jgi:hypothetical protein
VDDLDVNVSRLLDESNPSVRGSWSRIRSYLILYRRDCSV